MTERKLPDFQLADEFLQDDELPGCVTITSTPTDQTDYVALIEMQEVAPKRKPQRRDRWRPLLYENWKSKRTCRHISTGIRAAAWFAYLLDMAVTKKAAEYPRPPALLRARIKAHRGYITRESTATKRARFLQYAWSSWRFTLHGPSYELRYEAAGATDAWSDAVNLIAAARSAGFTKKEIKANWPLTEEQASLMEDWL